MESNNLLEVARSKYPIGTKFLSARNNLGPHIVTNEYFAFYQGNKNEIVVKKSNGPSVYKNGVWAEIINNIKTVEDYSYLIELFKRLNIK